MEARLQRVETEVGDVRERVSVLEERDRRLHEDMAELTTALQQNTEAVSGINKVTEKRGAFIAGAVFIIGAFSTIIGFLLTVLKDWFFS